MLEIDIEEGRPTLKITVVTADEKILRKAIFFFYQCDTLC